MPAQLKPTYMQVKSKFEHMRQTALEAAHESLPPVMSNKQGVAITKDSISLDGFTPKSQRELKRWENSGLRRVTWD